MIEPLGNSDADGSAQRIDDVDGTHYARIGVLDQPEPVTTFDDPQRELRAFRLEQAFSDDGGKTWEPNWIAKFTR